MLLFSGSANRTLASKLATELAIPLNHAVIERFPDSEYKIAIHTNVRNKHVCIIQPTSKPVNDHIIELCLLVNALRRAGARRITAVVPYFGYARQDYAAAKAGTPLSAEVIANIFNTLHIDQLVTLDLHAAKIKEFFNFTVHNLSSLNVFLTAIQAKMLRNAVIVAPDLGGAARASKFAKLLNYDLAVIAKQRSQLNDTMACNILGCVRDRDCILIDDILDTGNTICTAASVLKAHGARFVYAYCTHGVLSGNALERIYTADIEEIMLTDSIEQDYAVFNNKVKQITVAQLITSHLQKDLLLEHF